MDYYVEQTHTNRITSFGTVTEDWTSVVPFFDKWIKPKPIRVIFHPPATIVYWDDNTKTVVKCSENEEFIQEVGLAMSFIKKLYPNRSEFLRLLENAYYQKEE